MSRLATTGRTSTDTAPDPTWPTRPSTSSPRRTHERLEQLRAARQADLVPYFRVVESPALPVVEMEGAERIMLGSNNYLGLTSDPRVVAGARATRWTATAPA